MELQTLFALNLPLHMDLFKLPVVHTTQEVMGLQRELSELLRPCMLEKSTEPHLALLSYCSTEFPWCDLSPAQLLMGRKIRSIMPCPKMTIPKEIQRARQNIQKKTEKEL